MSKMAKAIVVLAAAGTTVAGAAGAASADAGALGTSTGSPGVLSGNVVQLPVHVPITLTGNSVNALGLLNPVSGVSSNTEAAGGPGAANAAALGTAAGSPGVLSGNVVQLPVLVPVTLTGNSVNVLGLLNPVSGVSSTNIGG